MGMFSLRMLSYALSNSFFLLSQNPVPRGMTGTYPVRTANGTL
jgi:hypothetical protein